MASSPTMKLVFHKGDFLAAKILIAAEYAGVELKQQTPSTTTPQTSQEERLLPVLHTSSGTLWESTAIARYISRIRPDSSLYGSTFFESAQVDQWIEFCSTELEIPVCCLTAGKAVDVSVSDVLKGLSVLDKHLLKHTFMVGDAAVSLADICLVLVVQQAVDNKKVEEHIEASCPHLSRWLETCLNQKQFKKHLSAFGLTCDAKKTAAEPAAGKKTQEETDDEKPAKKEVNALDLLPASTMVLDEWKRTYSNTKDLYGVAMKWFWEHLDHSAWSFWYMRYDKLADECVVEFVTSNQLNGFFQRVEPTFRKYSFGVIDVVEEAGLANGKKAYDIQGVWMFRGAEIPREMLEHPSFEYHTFEKLDPISNAKHKKLVEDYWCANESVESRVIADSKVWK